MAYFKTHLTEKEYYLSLAKRKQNPGRISKYRGVTKGSKNLPFRSQLSYKGKRYYLGAFETEVEAAKAYNRAALAIIGPHAVINDIELD